jgi:hypothetical protein
LYIIVNVATGTQVHKASIVDRNSLLAGILSAMTHANAQVRIAAVWCIINLTWTEDTGALERIAFLARFGFHERLEAMMAEASMDVRDPVITALNHFKSLTSDGTVAPAGGSGAVMSEGGHALPLTHPWVLAGSDRDTSMRPASTQNMDEDIGDDDDEDEDEDDHEDNGGGDDDDFFDDPEGY